MSTFEESNIRKEIKDVIVDKFGFSEQTLIQEKTIPPIMNGEDVMGESATGSGKTLAFGIGVIENAVKGKGVQGLIVTPTRELAEQVKKYIYDMIGDKLRVTSIYGGVAINPQINELKKAEIVIATPGRLKDHLERKTIDTSNVNVLVLDEADRMLDMGFIEDIEFIIKSCPKERQTLFFSATMPDEINKLAQKYTKNPKRISATKQVEPSKLEQVYYDVPRGMKFSLLKHLIDNETSNLVMVFCNTRKATDMVAKTLKSNDVDAVALHGGFTQNKRDISIGDFKEGKKHVLVCTDVAARGIHVEGISHIYNFDIPNDPTDYIHRVGRTARAGEEGKVINLLSEEDHGNFTKVLEKHKFNIKKMKKPYVEKILLQKDEDNKGKGNKKRGDNRKGGFSGRKKRRRR